MKSISDQTKFANFLKSQPELSSTGIKQVKSNVLEQMVDTVDSSNQVYPSSNQRKKKVEKSATAEYPPTGKRKIWKHKLTSSEIDTLTMKLSKIWDQASTLKEKDLSPFWTQQSKEISQRLWLPTKIDSVDSVLNSLRESSKPTPKGKSWFSIKRKHPQKKNSSMTSFQLSQYSLPASMDFEAIQSKRKSKTKPLKTLKLRLFPSNEEKEKLQTQFQQFRWYYNAVLDVVETHFENILDKNKYSSRTVRDIFRKYSYEEEVWTENLILKQFVLNENKNELPVPEWWKGQVHSRLPRGAINKFVSSLNAAISNFKNGNIKRFEMKHRRSDNPTDYLHYEDKQYPSFIRNIKSRYWFTTKDRKRKSISLKDVDTQGRGVEIIYEKETERYYLHYPVERDWFPEEDKRIENQNVLHSTDGNRIISLDPGVRKFLVGYDPQGECIFIGEGANKVLTTMLYDIDKTDESSERIIKWKKVKNMVDELHWKTINFLMENYDTILLPEFRVSQMVRGRKLPRIVKRMMLMYSFYQFKDKLKYKCEMYGKKLIIVDESYTSCTCTRCGTINKMGGLETYDCMLGCGIILDRDVVGARNIFIKNVAQR